MRRRLRSFAASWLLNALLRIFAMSIITPKRKVLRMSVQDCWRPTAILNKIGRAVQQECRDRARHSFPTRRSSDLAERPLKDIRDEYNYPKKKGIKDECSRLLEASSNLEIGRADSRNAETDIVYRLLLEKKIHLAS